MPTKNPDGSWKPGKWTPKIKGELVACENGYHITNKKHLIDWFDEELYEVEYKDELLLDKDKPDKYVVRQARLTRRIETWNEKNARLFAVWCAREGLKRTNNTDRLSINALSIAEKYANGEVTESELIAAALWCLPLTVYSAMFSVAYRAAQRAAYPFMANIAYRAVQYKQLWKMLGIEE